MARKTFVWTEGANHTDSVVGLDAPGAYKSGPADMGMPPAIEKLLTIFNKALPSIESELKKLGLWDDPTKYFNTEYMKEHLTSRIWREYFSYSWYKSIL